MVWTIIGLIVLSCILTLASQGREKQKERERIEKAEAEKKREFVKSVERQPDIIEKQWNRRINELNIDINKAERVKYYTRYYKDKSTYYYLYTYIWDEEGAIASFNDYKGSNLNITLSPMEWKINYYELVKIEGVYKRNDATILQFVDGSCIGFAPEEADKIKAIYKRAKQQTEEA